VTRETEWRAEWEVLRAERELARRRWRSAADGLAVRANDPLGLRRLVDAHPVAATGIGAAAGALLTKWFLGGARAPRAGRTANGGGHRPASVWSSLLRDAAVSLVVPWLLRMAKAKFGWDLQPVAMKGHDDAAPEAAPQSERP
jgi:hypothetical protein